MEVENYLKDRNGISPKVGDMVFLNVRKPLYGVECWNNCKGMIVAFGFDDGPDDFQDINDWTAEALEGIRLKIFFPTPPKSFPNSTISYWPIGDIVIIEDI